MANLPVPSPGEPERPSPACQPSRGESLRSPISTAPEDEPERHERRSMIAALSTSRCRVDPETYARIRSALSASPSAAYAARILLAIELAGPDLVGERAIAVASGLSRQTVAATIPTVQGQRDRHGLLVCRRAGSNDIDRPYPVIVAKASPPDLSDLELDLPPSTHPQAMKSVGCSCLSCRSTAPNDDLGPPAQELHTTTHGLHGLSMRPPPRPSQSLDPTWLDPRLDAWSETHEYGWGTRGWILAMLLSTHGYVRSTVTRSDIAEALGLSRSQANRIIVAIPWLRVEAPRSPVVDVRLNRLRDFIDTIADKCDKATAKADRFVREAAQFAKARSRSPEDYDGINYAKAAIANGYFAWARAEATRGMASDFLALLDGWEEDPQSFIDAHANAARDYGRPLRLPSGRES